MDMDHTFGGSRKREDLNVASTYHSQGDECSGGQCITERRKAEGLTFDMMRRIEEMNSLDMELYTTAVCVQCCPPRVRAHINVATPL